MPKGKKRTVGAGAHSGSAGGTSSGNNNATVSGTGGFIQHGLSEEARWSMYRSLTVQRDQLNNAINELGISLGITAGAQHRGAKTMTSAASARG